MKRAPALCLLTTLLAFYFLVPSSAVALSRVQRMTMQEDDGQIPSVESSPLEPKMKIERFVPQDDESVITARMVFETQDYASPGPNNHHKPPGWR